MGVHRSGRVVVRVAGGLAVKSCHRQQVVVRRVVCIRGHTALGVGDRGDQPGGVVADGDRLAGRGGQAGQLATRVAGGDPVAVGVLDVVQRAVGVVVGGGAVGLGQQVASLAVGRERAGVAGLGEERAREFGSRAGRRAGRRRLR